MFRTTLKQGESFQVVMIPEAIIGGDTRAVGGGVGASIGFGLKESSALGSYNHSVPFFVTIVQQSTEGR